MSGPLAGIRVVEMAGIGPGPFAAMMLADMGAEIIRIDRIVPGALGGGSSQIDRGRRSIRIDVKKPGAVELILRLIDTADALIEGFRPGVMERLGLGPEVCTARNPRLVYGRMTGWGQTGPLAQAAGHDLNYIALTGALHAMGNADRPPAPPLHLVGDLGGGAMFLAFGLVCALLDARSCGQGQVVDSAVCDGASVLSTMYHAYRQNGKWTDAREANTLDGGAHFYDCYTCADGKFISIGAIEPQFYRLLLEKCDIRDPAFEAQTARQAWPDLRARLSALFATRPRDYWCDLLEGTDACFAPVLEFSEAASHPHHRARENFFSDGKADYPAPAPRLSRTPPSPKPLAVAGHYTDAILEELGCTAADIGQLREQGVVA